MGIGWGSPLAAVLGVLLAALVMWTSYEEGRLQGLARQRKGVAERYYDLAEARNRLYWAEQRIKELELREAATLDRVRGRHGEAEVHAVAPWRAGT